MRRRCANKASARLSSRHGLASWHRQNARGSVEPAQCRGGEGRGGAEARSKLQDMGFKVTGTSRAEFATIIRDDTARWGKAVAKLASKAD